MSTGAGQAVTVVVIELFALHLVNPGVYFPAFALPCSMENCGSFHCEAVKAIPWCTSGL